MGGLEELFRIPFLTGLAFAVLLPLLGCYLRLRDEWLAALAYAHVAAAGALLAMALGWPLALGGFLAALTAAAGKQTLARKRDRGSVYALYLAGGWATNILLTANLPMAERVGHALFDGQLYFADGGHMAMAMVALGVGLIVLRALSRQLLLAQVYPLFFKARGLSSGPVHLGFDLLAAAVLAVATLALGVMGAFALVFIPAWAVYPRSRDWRHALWGALSLGLAGYGSAFALALALDQPFGPILCLCLIFLGLGWRVWRR